MGVRKRQAADAIKEARKSEYFAKLHNVPSSPRKMRLVVDMIRGQEAFKALGILKFSNKEAARKVEKLLRSAIANWEQKNERKAEAGELFVKTVFRRLRTDAQAPSSGSAGSRLQNPQAFKPCDIVCRHY